MGANVPFYDILALNVRTEIAYGMFSDGCTALSWHSSSHSNSTTESPKALLAQNWDWRAPQLANLVHLTIRQDGKPTIAMITEGGIIGKIGLNSEGLGVCLNAISARGVTYNDLPVHLALRAALDTTFNEDWRQTAGRGYLEQAIDRLKVYGLASSAHILVATASGAMGLECTYQDTTFVREQTIESGRTVTHTNHFINPQGGVKEYEILKDSPPRLDRVNELLRKQKGPPSLEIVQEILRDEEGYPGSICRDQTSDSETMTIFSIVMDLQGRIAKVKVGRPTEGGEEVTLDPSDSSGVSLVESLAKAKLT